MTFEIDAVIFDMDGLILDSEKLYTIVTDEILAPYNKSLTLKIKSDIMGRPGPDAARFLIEATNLGHVFTVDSLLAEMEIKLPIAFASVQPLPGAVKLIQHLAKHKIPIAIATGSKKSNYLIKTSSKLLTPLFALFGDKVMCGDDPILQGKGKPDPTIFLEAAKLLGIESEVHRKRTLVFEDGAPGVRAARSAGMEVIWVPDQEILAVMGDGHGLTPTQILKTLEDFVPEDYGLPPY